MSSMTHALSALVIALVVLPVAAQSDNIGHTRHHHVNNPKHPSAPDAARFESSRNGRELSLPYEDDAFSFVVFGDRTGGPTEGVSVLADAVRDANLIEPDFVMTVGDLVQGYNQADLWMDQMREFRGIMDRLLCPWFPVAGNHDIYWRGEGRPAEEHEGQYEMHFGPLWYAFEHKNCWFIALYSDEGNPETGERNFEKPECQRMSDAQFEWLRATLAKAHDADHVFLFLHHPRWLGGNYGDDWEKVHKVLVEAGNVSGVFAGHIHRMRYDPADGIEYVALATVGGAQGGVVPSAGWLHQYHIVTVRKGQVAMASVPVGEIQDVREITGELADEAARLARSSPEVDAAVPIGLDGHADQLVTVRVRNPGAHEVEVAVTPECADSRWSFLPDHQHTTMIAGSDAEFSFQVTRWGGEVDRTFRLPNLAVDMDLLAPGARYPIPTIHREIPLEVELSAPPVPSVEMALDLDGRSGAVRVDSDRIELPDGPMTLECWFNARRYTQRMGLVGKTEGAEYGFFVSEGRPEFYIHVGGRYVELRGETGQLDTGAWHHIAGVFDGGEARLYLDGRLIAKEQREGKRRRNALPMLIGADVSSSGRATDFFDGMIDSVRLSRTARYTGEHFTPERRARADADAVLTYNMDSIVGVWLYDESSGVHPRVEGHATVAPAP